MALASVVAWVLWASAAAVEGEGPAREAPKAEALVLTPAPVTAAPAELLRFDELPAPVPPDDDRRVKRFLGALAGGAVGFAAPLAMMPLGDTGCFGPFCGPSGTQLALSAFVPVTTAVGAWLGFLLAGGEGGPLTPLASLLPGAVVGVLLFALATAAQQAGSMLSLMPFLITTGVVTVGSAALALDARSRQLDALGGARSWGSAPPARALLTPLVTLLGAGAGVLLTALVASTCRDLACGLLAGTVGASALVGTALATWGVHRALGGRGSVGSVFLALGLVAGVSLAGLPVLVATTSSFPAGVLAGPAAAMVGLQFALGAALFFPTLALEWSHADAIGALASKVTLSAAPTPGGGVVAAALRF